MPSHHSLPPRAEMADADDITRAHFAADLRSSVEKARQAVSTQRAHSLDLFWTQHWVPYTAWTPSYPLWRTKYPTSASSRTAFDPAPPAAVVSRSGLHAYVTKSSPLQRVSPTWVNLTCASRLLDSWTHGSPGCIQPTHTKIRPHTALNPSQSKSSTMPRLSSTPPP